MDMIPECVWNEIKKVIPIKQPGSVGRPARDAWRVLSGILFIARAGTQWKYLPEIYGPPSTVHGRFIKWVESGVFSEIMHAARQFYQGQEWFDEFWLAIDTSHSKAPFAVEGGKNPTDRGKRGVKRIVVTDRRGAPLAVCVAPSNTHDSKLLKMALEALGIDSVPNYIILTADSAFDAKKLRAHCKKMGIILVASTNVRRRKGVEKIRVKGREVVERTFGIQAWYRGLKICWTKRLDTFLAFLQLASSLQLFRMV